MVVWEVMTTTATATTIEDGAQTYSRTSARAVQSGLQTGAGVAASEPGRG